MSHFLMADDLSGALEAGAAFRAQGWRVVLPLQGDVRGPAAGELRLVSTESRNLGPEAAAGAVRSRLAGAPGARWLFKKVDSTLRGPIGAELSAMLEELAPKLVIFCPANPVAGRTVRHGVLRVFGVPLTGTEFRDDPHWPATESNVAAVLSAQGLSVAGQVKLPELRRDAVAAIERARTAGPGPIVTIDAETTADLEKIVRAGRAVEPDVLFVGSGALATVVASQMAPAGRSLPPMPQLSSLMILGGTANPITRRQIEHAAKHALVSVVVQEVGRGQASVAVNAVEQAWRERPVVAVRFTAAAGSGGGEAARAILASVAELAREIHERLSPEAYFVTGGETAWAVCHALGGTQLEVLTEVETGVVVSVLRRENLPSVIIITKPGGFGDEATLTRLVRGA